MCSFRSRTCARLHAWVYEIESGTVMAFDDNAGQYLPVAEAGHVPLSALIVFRRFVRSDRRDAVSRGIDDELFTMENTMKRHASAKWQGDLKAGKTKATLTFEKLEAGWTVTQIHLDVKEKVPKADQAAWKKATAAAKSGCPISRLLNTTITMEAKLEG
jgi:hypothetical protein